MNYFYLADTAKNDASVVDDSFCRWQAALSDSGQERAEILDRNVPAVRFSLGGPDILQVEAYSEYGKGLLYLVGKVLDRELIGLLQNGTNGTPVELGAIRRSEGMFAYLFCTHENGEFVEFGTDKLQQLPVYTNSIESPDIIASHVTLCGAMSGRFEICPDTALDFVIKDAVLPEASMLKGIFRLKRAKKIIHQRGKGFSIVPDNFPALGGLDVSEDDAIDSLLRATKSLADYGGPLLGLTGGRDSRLMLAACNAAGIEFETATHNHPCVDSKIAGQLALISNVRHSNMRRAPLDAAFGFHRYLSKVPVSEGFYHLPSFEAGLTVYDLAAERQMLHIGGLGGEVIRSYWDAKDANFDTPQLAIEQRFFKPRYDRFYSSPEQLADSKKHWSGLIDKSSHLDSFASLQAAYLDTRLRGIIGARGNGADGIAWPLANSALYHHALRLRRCDRQSSNIFERLIKKLDARLLDVKWLAGTAGIYRTAGLAGWKQNWKQKLAKSTTLLRVATFVALSKNSSKSANVSSSSNIAFRWYFGQQGQLWSRKILSKYGMKSIEAQAKIVPEPIEKLFGVYLLEKFIRSLDTGEDWRKSASKWMK